jgi:hypothetical protein
MDLNPDLAVRRISRLMAGLAVAGAGGGAILFGWTWGVSFLLGAVASWVSFFAIKKAVFALGPDLPKTPPKARSAILVGLRYGLLGLGAYAILKFSTVPINGALCGLFVPAAAATLEILFELFYARTS